MCLSWASSTCSLPSCTARALREDVEDQAGAVDHAPLQRLLQVALLDRAERVVDQHQVGAGGVAGGLHFLQLAAADQGGRVRAVDACGQHRGHAGAGGARQFGEFLQHALEATGPPAWGWISRACSPRRERSNNWVGIEP
jgi:hypothetical protein